LKPPKALIDVFRKENSFLILTHTTPDGDAFGSCLALKFLIEQFSKKAEIYTEYPIPLISVSARNQFYKEYQFSKGE